MRMTSDLLNERETTHGKFSLNSHYLNGLLEAIPLDAYEPRVRYAIVAIYIKLSRMASGDAFRREHWEDVAGYAHLVLEAIESEALAESGGITLCSREVPR